MSLDASDRFGKHSDRIFIAALGLIQHRLVIHNVEAARRILARLDKRFLSFVHLVQFAINLGEAEIDIRVIRHQIGKLLVNLQRFRIVFFGKQGLPKTALVAGLAWVEFRGFPIGSFCFRQVLRLRVRVAKKIEQCGRRRLRGHAFEKGDSVSRFAFIQEQLRQLLDSRFVLGIAFQNSAQNLFRFVVLVLKTVKAGEPQG